MNAPERARSGEPLAGAPTSAVTLTLAVPYYSGFALFLHTLRSIAGQSYPHCRVLVCDDSPSGLTDAERAEAAAVVAGSFPLRIVKNAQNLGMARTWNRCLDEAESDLVTIVHNDDELTPDYARVMVELAAQHREATALFCGASIIGETGRGKLSVPDLYKLLLIPRHDEVLQLTGDHALSSLLRGNYIFCPTVCYRKSKLHDRRFDPRYRMVLDMDLTTRILLAGESLVGVPKQPLYRYRRHDDNATSHLTKELTRFEEEAAFYLDVARRAELRGYRESVRVGRARRVIKLNLTFCIVRDLLGRQWPDSARKTALLRQLLVEA